MSITRPGVYRRGTIAVRDEIRRGGFLDAVRGFGVVLPAATPGA